MLCSKLHVVEAHKLLTGEMYTSCQFKYDWKCFFLKPCFTEFGLAKAACLCVCPHTHISKLWGMKNKVIIMYTLKGV